MGEKKVFRNEAIITVMPKLGVNNNVNQRNKGISLLQLDSMS